MNRLEVRIRKLECPSNEDLDLVATFGDNLPGIVDDIETTLAQRRGLPREQVRLDLRREGLYDRFTTAELLELEKELTEKVEGSVKK